MTALFFLGVQRSLHQPLQMKASEMFFFFFLNWVVLTWPGLQANRFQSLLKWKKDFLKNASSFIPLYIYDFDSYYFWGINEVWWDGSYWILRKICIFPWIIFLCIGYWILQIHFRWGTCYYVPVWKKADFKEYYNKQTQKIVVRDRVTGEQTVVGIINM